MLENNGLFKNTMGFILKHKDIFGHNIPQLILDKQRMY